MVKQYERAESEVVKKVFNFTEIISCDFTGCDAIWTSNDEPEDKFAEIYLWLNPEECVSSRWIRNFCPEHWNVWDKMCVIIGVDPEELGRDDDN